MTCAPHLDDLLDAVDGVSEQGPHLLVVVHVVRVTDAHEQDVGRQAGQLLQGHTRPQLYNTTRTGQWTLLGALHST